MNKKVIFLVMPVVLLVFCFVFASCENTKDFGFEEKEGAITITDYYGDGGNVKIPNKIKGKLVRFIEDEAFKGKKLTGIIIPNNVISIGDEVFQDNQLASVTIPDSVTAIGDRAFQDNQLTNAIISNKVTAIGTEIFKNNQLTSITIPNGVTAIGNGAFYNNQLTSITISDTVTTIGDMAFMSNQLAAITIPGAVTSMGVRVFFDNPITDISVASDNTVYSVNDSFLLGDNGKQLILYFGNESTVSISNGVTTIGDDAFADKQLTSVTIPNSVTAIGEGAFMNNQITRIVFPNSVRRIGANAFAGNQLNRITIGANVVLGSRALNQDFVSQYNEMDSWNKPFFALQRQAGIYANDRSGVWEYYNLRYQ